MSDHSKFQAEEAWASQDAHVIHDVTRIDDVLAENEMARFDAYVDAMSDAHEDGDAE